LATSRVPFDQDYVINQVRQSFQCTVLWCEGRQSIIAKKNWTKSLVM